MKKMLIFMLRLDPHFQKGDLVTLLSNLGKGDILFIDEIHRLSPVIEETLYPAMEDFKCDYVIGSVLQQE